jgi:bla regulator protein blaR1
MTRSSAISSRKSRSYLWTVLTLAAISGSLLVALAAAPIVVTDLRAAITSEQSDAARLPSFEVASVKLNKSSTPMTGGHFFEGRWSGTGDALAIIQFAFGENGISLSANEVSGGPDWIKSETYDIEAKVDDDLVQGEWKKLTSEQRFDQVRLMMRSLLADRFKLKVRRETKELPVYALVVDKSGPKLKEDNAHPELSGLQALGRGKLEATSLKLNFFAFLLSRQPELGGRRVLDRTGLKANYSFKFQWTPETLSAAAAQSGESALPPDLSGTSLFSALREQLGLKLESTKAPVDTFVIEHIEKPSGN